MHEDLADLEAFADEVRDDGTTDVVLLGMGGSSLAPEVIRRSFGEQDGRPRLHVLDSTDAGAIRDVEAAIDLDHALFLVSTKSGGTIETLSLFKHFWSRRGDGNAFVAITDPGSGLEDLAREHGFRRIFLNDPDIGGRYSALSYFGLVPAALMGADVAALLDAAGVAEQNCQSSSPATCPAGCGWARRGASWRSPAATSSPTSSTRRSRASASGSSSSSPSRPASTARASCPWSTSRSGAPEVYGDDRIFLHLRHGERARRGRPTPRSPRCARPATR